MSITEIQMLFKFIGGLGMFLYGMDAMADGLQKSAGHKMQQLLGVLTSNRLMGVLLGTGITAIIQSSSATTVMVVGFVNAGIINLQQAVGIIMGANIGTTVTSWIVSMSEWGEMMKPEFFAPALVGVGAVLSLFTGSGKKKQVGEILVGFGVLFIGLSFMSDSITPYRNAPIFSQAFAVLGKNPLLGILAGLVVTGIIQSSSASVGILQTLALNGIVNWQSAIFITLGQNIGTCVTALLSSLSANKTAKRAAVIHLLFNVVGAVIFGCIMFVVFKLNPVFAASRISSVGISIFHTIFNVSNTIILFPFAGLLVKASGLLVREDQKESTADSDSPMKRHLDERILETPSFAIENVNHEVVSMGNAAMENLDLAAAALLGNNRAEAKLVEKMEQKINDYEKILTDYLIKLNNQSLNEEQHLLVKNLFYTISDFERVSDHCENLSELAIEKSNRNIIFSKDAENEIKEMIKEVRSSLEHAIKARETGDMTEVRAVIQSEERVDSLEEELRERHIERLSAQTCKPENGVIFLDALSNLERISDHAHNIAGYVRDEM
ncbi:MULTISPECIES: Na/Pi cotransporter family protein [Clostridia]|uniref:Na/Pi cotransporter n=1 Tax=Lacrimispora celerecrescens TaxID=29354 RepID=A0A084JJH5_9FIRM|nr:MULTISPECIES: Na/Pi cotransporter family protein [Clostridia]KEZ89109.1 Na/Pi cotransporter [Lacrimispora celerecrescens]MBW4846172.1 Na/Pi cotransporter family protein [Lachnospiraceae bacterium]MSS07474.1 Na/Pi cotransporter family protein [Clostridium sp. WB02_MRS01]HBG11774.1 Na/Pi cotransporter family protein [Clostridium sp.]